MNQAQIIGRRITIVFVVAVVLLVVASRFIYVVDAGYVGIAVTFGSVDNNPLYPGLHIINPLSEIIPMNSRTVTYTMTETPWEGEVKGDDSINTLAKDGGSVNLDISVFYRIDPNKAATIYRTLGLNFSENIIRPEIRTTIRDVVANYTVNELYSTKREEVAFSFLNQMRDKVALRGVIIEDVLLRKVTISQVLSDSIEQKLKSEQEVQKLQFEIDKSRKEAEKKVIEAQAQKQAQDIINSGLTTNYLYYLYISQLKDRQGTIYVPTNPANGMPLFKSIP
jgi:regulator of protease activity HflC (stomatin/prohibitin superfamily)